MFDFNKYDDAIKVFKFNGFIDELGNFYKVGLKKNKNFTSNFHNEWASKFIKENLNIKDFKFNPTTSALFTLVSLNSPSEILVNCFGYVYYSHDPLYYKPIIKIPNPKIANYKVTEEQLNMLYSIMTLNKEDTDISIFYDDNTLYNYTAIEDDGYQKKLKY